jgi:hypothetical protein
MLLYKRGVFIFYGKTPQNNKERAVMPKQHEAPDASRAMFTSFYGAENQESIIPKELTFILDLVQSEANAPEDEVSLINTEASPLQHLLNSIKQEIGFVTETTEEQVFARTLLVRFGLPWLPGAEEVWLMLSERLTEAKEVTQQAQLQLEQAINQVRALLVSQLTTDQENELKILQAEERQQQDGMITLQESGAALADEADLDAQKNGALILKKERLSAITIEKRQVKKSIESMRAMVSNLLLGLAGVRQFDQTELVIA